MLLQWIIVYTVLLVESIAAGVICPTSSCDVTIDSKAINSIVSLEERVIELVESQWSSSLTICIYPGVYNATSGRSLNFYNFSNIVMQKDPYSDGEVTIRCPYYTSYDEFEYNGLGFFNAENITICGLSFTECGSITSGLYFENSKNVQIIHSTFSRNTNTGVGINLGKNFTIINCTFAVNVGMQLDDTSYLIQDLSYKFGGTGLGISLENITDFNMVVDNCTFENNVAHKTINNSMDDERTYQYVPFGSGAAIYVRMKNAAHCSIKIIDSYFYNNTASHQGGAIAMFLTDSSNNMVEVSNCLFFDNKAIGYFLVNQEYDDLDVFIAEVNVNFSVNNFDNFVKNARNISSKKISQTGGVAGSLLMAFYGNSEFNRLCIKDSSFKRNLAFGAAGIGFFIRGNLFNVSNGLNSNWMWVDRCNFSNNYALLGGSAFGVSTVTRIDIGNKPVIISDSKFIGNVNAQDFRSTSYRFGINAAISTIHLPLNFLETNVFLSNIGGCITTDNAKVDISGRLDFISNYGSLFGSGIRIGGLSLVQLFPNAYVNFSYNNASLGGALAVDNTRVEDDLPLILNYNCFLQYNIGKEDEQCPSQWKTTILFNDNKAAVQGDSVYAEDISGCTSTPCYNTKINSNKSTYSNSLFSLPKLFHYTVTSNASKIRKRFATAPSNLTIDKMSVPMHVFPGEQFDLHLHVYDQNDNSQIGVYTYPSNTHFTEANVIEIDLTDSGTDRSFAVVSSKHQRTALVIRDSSENFVYTHCLHQKNDTVDKRKFVLHLIDLSNGNVVSEVKLMTTLKCCHPTYEYNKTRGKCMFKQEIGRNILRGDNNGTYFYIRSEKYGEFGKNGDLIIGRIPSFYQHCHNEEGLPGCLVKHDHASHQCREGRTGLLCGQCPQQSADNKTQGLAFNLLQCVTCDAGDALLFALICIFIVVASLLIMYYNVRLPNSLRGFLYYAQVVGYVYINGERNGTLDWDFYLSRVLGFSFYFPLCLTHMEALQVNLFGFLPPILILMSIISYTILARKLKPLSNKKTLDGIWFLILIIYVYTFDTCCNLLRCVGTEIHTNDFNTTVSGSLVYFYDGSVTCFQDQHIPYAVISILTLVLFVIPFPFIVVAISWNYVKKTGPFFDVVNTGIKPVYNWWSGYDLFRRVLFVAVYYVLEYVNGDYTRVAMFICAVIFLLITSRICPYDKWRVNLVEWLILLNLVVITAYFASTQSVDRSSFGTFIFVLPYVYLLTYLVIKCFRKTKSFTVFRKRIHAATLTIVTYLGNSDTLLVVGSDTMKDVVTDNSYVELRDELQILTDYD